MIERRTSGARVCRRDDRCTSEDTGLYSHRRATAQGATRSRADAVYAPVTGRFATVAWIDEQSSCPLFADERAVEA